MPSADSFSGKGLAADLERLDEIAASLNLPLLSQFIDSHTMMREALNEEDIPANCPPELWYSAQEGLSTVDGLLLHVRRQPEQLSRPAIFLVAELKQLAMLLEEAKAQGTKFHL